jgi:FkbM family methyltransferase
MPDRRNWIGELLLRSPASLRALRNVPVFGNFIHRLSHQVLPADEKVWAQVEAGPARGLWFELNPRTGQAYLRGEPEPAMQKILAERLRPGMVFYDLGANIGYFSMLAARIVGTRGRVFSFEPDPKTASRLRKNVARNNLTNVTIVEAGIWSSSGTARFVAADPSSPDRGTGRFAVTGGTDHSLRDVMDALPVQCVALDDFVANSPPPDAIKCDVEGAEVEALRGAENLIRTRRPWILCEMHSETSARVTSEYLTGFGYTLEPVDDNHILALP